MLSSAEPTARVLSSDRASEVKCNVEPAMVPAQSGHDERSLLDGFREGRREGFEKGHEIGLAAGREQLSGALAALASAVNQLESAAATDNEHFEEMAVGLAVELAELILGRELEASSSVGVDAIRRAMSMAVHKEPIKIHMCREDVEDLGDAVPARVTIVVDPTVSPGCADIHLGDGLVQVNPMEAIARVREALK